MSQTLQTEYDEDVIRAAQHLNRESQKLKGTSVWFNPLDEYIYVASQVAKPEFQDENKVAHAPTLNKLLTDIAKYGSIQKDAPEYDQASAYVGKFQAPAEDHWKGIVKTAASGGVMVPDNFDTTIDMTNVLSRLRGVEEPKRTLQDAAEIFQTNLLEGRIDVQSGFDIHKNVPMSAEIPTNQVTYTTVNFKLPMLGAHIARAQELKWSSLSRDPYRNSIDHVGKALIKAKAEIVRDAIEAATTSQAGSSWAAFTGGESSNKPDVDLGSAEDTIDSNGGNANAAIMNGKTHRAFNTNSWESGKSIGSNSSSSTPKGGTAKVVPIGDYGYTGYVDNLATGNQFILYDKSGVLRFDGPQEVFTYDDRDHRLEGYQYWEYLTSKIIEDNKFVIITGVAP